MQGGKDSNCKFWMDDVMQSDLTILDIFIIDNTSYPLFIGCERDTATTYTSITHGFIYEIHFYQTTYTTAAGTHYVSAGCTDPNGSACHGSCPEAAKCLWQEDFNAFNDAGTNQACDSASCDPRSCVRTQNCQAECDSTNPSKYCNLCYDRECTGCTNYTGCEADKCAASAAAVSNNGDQCECNEGYGRPTGADSVNHVCQACCPGCATCDQGGQTNFGDCLSCLATHYALQINATTYFMCLEYCPTQWGGSHPTCTAPSDLEIIHQNLADFASPWGIVESADAGSSTYPGKERGQHFNGTDQYLLFNPNFKLAPSFTMEIWIWCTDLSVERSILGKDRGVTADNTVFRAGIEVTTGLLFAELANKDFTSLVKTTATSGTNITNTAWAKVGFSIALQDNAVDSDVRLWISDTAGVDAGVTQTASGAYYSDSASGYAG